MSEPPEPDRDRRSPTAARPDRAQPGPHGGPLGRRPAPAAYARAARSVDPQVSGARPDDRDPKLLSAAVDDLVRAKGWATDINVHTLLARWPLLVGPANAAHSRPEAYADAVLTVRTDSTAWATQLRMMAPQLVALLNDHLGDGTDHPGRHPRARTRRRGRRAAARSATAAAPATPMVRPMTADR